MPVAGPDRSTAPPATSRSIRPAIVVERVGPYHAARFKALANRLPGNVLALEVYLRDATYQWDIQGEPGEFQRQTLFSRPEDCRRFDDLKRGIFTALDGWRPTVVAVPGWSDPAALSAMAWCRVRARPCILMSDSTKEDAPRVWWREAVKRAILRRVDTALVAGQRQQSYLVELGFDPDWIEDGYDVVDNDHFAKGAAIARQHHHFVRERMGLPARYFLYVGRFVEKKNLRRLLDAFALYRSQTDSRAWSLVLVGDGPDREALEARAQEADLASAVLIHPFAQYDALPAYYGLADALVLPSLTDQWGLVVNEAMASGLPVLLSDRCGCFDDLLVEGKTGFGFNPADTATIAQRLARMTSGDVDRVEMGAAARELIGQWSLDRFAKGFIAASAHGLVQSETRRANWKARFRQNFDGKMLKGVAHLGFRPPG